MQKGVYMMIFFSPFNCMLNQVFSGCIVLLRKVCRRETPLPSMSRPIHKLLGNVTRSGELWEYSNQAGRGGGPCGRIEEEMDN